MRSIRQKYVIKAPAEEVWKGLVDSNLIDKWGGGPAVMDDRVGTKFSLWGGDVHGVNVEVVKNKLLVQGWFGGKWPKASKVTFTLAEKGGNTELNLLHEDVPDEEEKDITDGWKSYYLGPMKELLEK